MTVAGSQRCLWVDAAATCVSQTGSLANQAPCTTGGEPSRPGFAGTLDEVEGFAVALDAGELAADATPP